MRITLLGRYIQMVNHIMGTDNMEPLEKYWSMADLMKRFSCARSTIYTWMGGVEHPFPKPVKFGPGRGCKALWVIESVLEWEK